MNHTFRDMTVCHLVELLHGFTQSFATICLFGPRHPFKDRAREIEGDIDCGKPLLVCIDWASGLGSVQKMRSCSEELITSMRM